jgi:hypothetical protein
MDQRITRRGALALGGGLALGTTTMAAAQDAKRASKTTASRRLDLAQPADNVTAYLKLRASIETQDVYFWFTGRLDVAVPGERRSSTSRR